MKKESLDGFSTKEIIKSSFAILKKDYKTFAKIVLVTFLLQVILTTGSNILDGLKNNSNFGGGFLFSFWSLGFTIIGVYAGLIVEIGLIRTVLSVLRKKDYKFIWKDLFPFVNFSYLIRYFVVSLLYGLIVFGGFLLFIFPGIYFAIKYSFAEILFIDKEIGIKEAFRLSGQITKGIKFRLVIFGLVLFGVNILGVLALFVGLFYSVPLTMISSYYLYNHLLKNVGEK